MPASEAVVAVGTLLIATEDFLMHPPALHVAHGMCYVLFAYDIGLAIDLEACARLLAAVTERVAINPKQRTLQYFEYGPAPLYITQETQALTFGTYRSETRVDMVLYDFGAVSMTYRIPLQGSWFGLLGLSDDLYDNAVLLHAARQGVEQLLAMVQGAVQRPHIADFVEDYVIFQIEAFTTACRTEELRGTYAQEVAQLLRVEHMPLATQEVQDVLSHQITHGLDDLIIIDWHAALLYAREAHDVRAVLKFANVELLEMRYLDEQLDDALEQAYATLSRRAGRRLLLPGSSSAALHRIAHMQVDSAMLFEGVNNALKLLGDQYLARVYRLASQRFHLEEWDASILRKLHTLDSIYAKIADWATNRRMETLEWIIIILIAVSILLPFFTGIPRH
jgi:hypothetical protein